MLKFLSGLLSTLIAIALAALSISKAKRARSKQNSFEVQAAEAKQFHKLGEVRKANANAAKWEKKAAQAERKAEEKIDVAAERHETPDLDRVVSDYNRKLRDRAKS